MIPELLALLALIFTCLTVLLAVLILMGIFREKQAEVRRDNLPGAACDPVHNTARRSSPSEVPASLERDAT